MQEPQFQPEWLDDEADTHTDQDEVLDTTESWLIRHRFIVRFATWATAIGLVATAAVTVLRHNDQTVPTAPAAPLVAAPANVHEVQQSPSIKTVLALAHAGAAATDYVRQTSPPGSCRMVNMGSSPTRRIMQVLRDNLPAATSLTVARTLDEFTALCSVEIRAQYRSAVLAVSITAPSSAKARWRYAHIETGIVTSPGPGPTTVYALNVSRNGWHVLAGATGPMSSLPGSADLLAFAQNPRLTW